MQIPIIITILFFFYSASGELNLQDVEIPDFDDFSQIKEKCDKLGGNGTYDKLKESKDSIETCLQGFVDFNVLKNEVEEAKKDGSMDEVFGKYCAKRPKVAACVQNFTNALRPCLNTEEKKALNTTLDILKQLGEFICFRDGDRIAMFVAEGGVECFKDHAEGIKNCINSTFKISPTVNTNSLPNLLMDKKKCDDLGKFQVCVVEELEKCKDSTPANIVDALIRFIKRSACNNKTKRNIHSLVKRSTAIAHNLYNVTDFKNKAMKIIEDKCSQNAPDEGFEAFKGTLENATQCLVTKFKTDVIFTTPLDDFKQNFKNCIAKLIETARACLPAEEKYYPEFYLEQTSNAIDFLYKNKDIILLKSSRTELINCFQNFKESSAKRDILKCVTDNESTDLKKAAVCGRLTNVQTCVNEQVKKKCIRDITITKLMDDYFHAVLLPCNKN